MGTWRFGAVKKGHGSKRIEQASYQQKKWEVPQKPKTGKGGVPRSSPKEKKINGGQSKKRKKWEVQEGRKLGGEPIQRGKTWRIRKNHHLLCQKKNTRPRLISQSRKNTTRGEDL